jgi:dienelactone hydrolase
MFPTFYQKILKKAGFYLGLIFWTVFLTSCATLDDPSSKSPPTRIQIEPASMPITTTDSNQVRTNPATPSRVATITQTPTLTAIPLPSVLGTTTSAPTLSPTPNPYDNLTINALSNRDYGGGLLDIVDTIESNEAFTRYLITYPSDGLTIYGFMNVPNEGDKFPVAIMLHGYVTPNQYNTLAYTRRYADVLAEAGFFVIHPNFRNYPPSDSGPDPYRVGFAIDVLNLIAIIKEQSQDPNGYLRRSDPENIHLWGHSMGGGVALRVLTVNNDPYIKAAVLYGSMSGDERLNYERIREWSNGLTGEFELTAPEDMLVAISPINYLDRITAAISIHHSDADQVVPPEWSDDLCQQLKELKQTVECHSYIGLPHTFRGQGDALFIERTVDFFNRY